MEHLINEPITEDNRKSNKPRPLSHAIEMNVRKYSQMRIKRELLKIGSKLYTGGGGEEN